jgi:Protein of unknown function (DUF1501)
MHLPLAARRSTMLPASATVDAFSGDVPVNLPAGFPQAKNCFSARRLFLQSSAGAAGALWSGWSRLATAQPKPNGKAKSVILIFNCGAPSHIDLWDPKPDASDTVRGEFQTISTNVAGIQVSELLPELAQRTDKLAIVRSVHHTQSSHNSGMYYSIVGRPYRIDNTLINPSPTDIPCFGTLVGWLAKRDGYTGAVPPYVITPEPHCDSKVYITPGQFGGCLGAKYDPFVLQADPNAADFRVRNLRLIDDLTTQRLQQRSELLGKLGASTRPVPSPSAAEYDQRRAEATALVTSGDAARAFDLSQEPTAIRERYGRHTWGQSHLLARRLVEHGTRFVTTVNGPSITWDTHLDNFGRLKNKLVPPMEQAYAALLDDLSDRGLLDSTLVIWMGDFGRTPTINKDAGRDHWPPCYTVVLAGGGIRGGQTIGASDKIGAYPKDRPLSPADIHATIFRLLGYDPSSITYHTSDSRPILLSDGDPIRELL